MYFENKNVTKLVVFIHGINGSAQKDGGTWTNNETGFYWPEELSKDPEFLDADA